MLRIVWHVRFVLLLCSLLTASASARAQDEPSSEQLAAGNELLEAGKRAYAQGQLSEALYDFEQAYARTRRASILYRIADAADKLGDHERAIDAFQQYLGAFPTGKDRAFVEGRIAANRQALAAPVQSRALTPEAAARAAEPAKAADAPVVAVTGTQETPALRAWWLWAGAGVVVVAGVVVAAVLLGGSSTRHSGPVMGNVGGVVETLHRP